MQGNAQDSIRIHLEEALDRADDPTVRYDIRQSLQLLESFRESAGTVSDDD